jgi:sortase A
MAARPMIRRAVTRRRIAGGMLIAAAFCFAMLGVGIWIPAKAGLAQILLERAWSQARAGRLEAKPWPWADTFPVARLSIPGLGVSWIVLSGASGRNLAFAPSHLDGSAAPGDPGVSVIAAHRDTHFRALEDLAPGTEILVETPTGDMHRFRVARTEVVDVRTTRLRLDSETPVLVLSTCYPFDAIRAGGPLRFLIEAEAVPG